MSQAVFVVDCIRAERRVPLSEEWPAKGKGTEVPPLPPFLQVGGGAVCFY